MSTRGTAGSQLTEALSKGEVDDIGSLKTLANRIATTYINRRLSPNMRKAVIAYTLGVGAYGVGKKWWEYAKGRMVYTISVESDDDIYDEVHDWLIQTLPKKRQRSLSVISTATRKQSNEIREDDDVPAAVGGYGTPTPKRTRALRFFYDGSRVAHIQLDGQKVQVEVERPEQQAFDPDRPFVAFKRNDVITFTTWGAKGRDAVIALLDELSVKYNESEPQRPKFYMTSRYGDWNRQSDVPLRSLESMVLREGQLDEIVNDLGTFLSSEDKYTKLGIPYHRGYLLSGPPGTGKSSMAKALAEHFDMDLYYIHLSSMEKDANLVNLVAGVGRRSLCLIEDIDRLKVAQEDEASDKGLTMSGLLNVLDGISTPYGIVFILTTNHEQRLDPALIRPGRVDLKVEVSYVDNEQAERLMTLGYDRPFDFSDIQFEGADVSPADIVDIIKRNFTDPDAAEKEVRGLLDKPS